MSGRMFWIILLCGVGTFLLRWLPLWRARRRPPAEHPAALWQKLLAGVGPAAIAALLVVSAAGLLAAAAGPGDQALRVAVALGCAAATRCACRGSVAVPTLVGALVYGVLTHVGG